ncbi:MAG TPA: alanine racemase [Kofleriaceae bacterium]|nr:alanine racemase [Kofleriaceae bacterium]
MNDRWSRYLLALGGEPLPAALIDLDALEANAARLYAPIARAGKRARIATKSLRCPALAAKLAELGGATAIGYLTYTAAETEFYARAGVRDLVLAYPTVQPQDAGAIARANAIATAAIVVDDVNQLDVLAAAARDAGTRIPIIIDVDMSWRPFGVHVGVRRSPLREPDEVIALAMRIAEPLHFHGILGYEAQLAGLSDRNAVIRALKRGSEPAVVASRARIVDALAAAGLPPTIVNGGGTGSVDWSSTDPALTEVAVGSGFLCSHLFDDYRGLELSPAIAFALQVVRRPAPNIATCLGGGWIASGQAGADRLPIPAWPLGCALLRGEGAGEVQTPVVVPPDRDIALGDPIFFRPAKSGELAEHVAEYLFVRGDRIVDRAPTYRGLGRVFLG